MGPEPPKELWMLWVITSSTWLKAIDCAGEPLLAFVSKADAEAGMEKQFDMYGVASVPVRMI